MNRLAGATTSLMLLAAGAIMAFAVRARSDGFNVNTLGWILMSVGAAGVFASVGIGTADSDEIGVTYTDSSYAHAATGEHPTIGAA